MVAEGLIEVQIQNGHGFVWKVDDIYRLRREFRLLGSLVGCGSLAGDEQGVPLLLAPQEIQVLKDENAVSLYRLEPETGCRAVLEEASAAREKSYEQQINICREEKVKQIENFSERIFRGKLAKLRKLSDKSNHDLTNVTRETVIAEEIDKIQTISRGQQVVQILNELPWLAAAGQRVPCHWTYPEDVLNKCRLFAFRRLRKEGYFIGEGSKFGGDFLVYPGDPVRYHAKYILICQGGIGNRSNSGGRPDLTRVQDIVAKTRLGGQVAKTVLIARLAGEEVVFHQMHRAEPSNETRIKKTLSASSTSSSTVKKARPYLSAGLQVKNEDSWSAELEL